MIISSEPVNDIDEYQHSKLLTAIKNLDENQRIQPPSRTEPSLEISEYHVKPSKKNKIKLQDVAKSLLSKPTHSDIAKRVFALKSKKGPTTLRKPLEKPVAERIKRSVGYGNIKKQLQRWDAVVFRNRASEQLKFPLSNGRLRKDSTRDFLDRFKVISPLEMEINSALGKSQAVQEEKEKEAVEYKMSLEEMLARRKEIAHIKAQQSYREAKAHRQNKIKSKQYHRVQRRERMKQQLKQFEMLQKTDPEAALKQLEELERIRAEERMTLRHKNTGKWAQGRAIRAKYDLQSRRLLAEQLALSRELTQKPRAQTNSDDDNDDGDETEPVNSKASSNEDNPWMSSEVKQFMDGYSKFCEKVQKEKQPTSSIQLNLNHPRDRNKDMSENCPESPLVERNSIGSSPLENCISNNFSDIKDNFSTNDKIILKGNKVQNQISKFKYLNNESQDNVKFASGNKKNHKKSIETIRATTNNWIVKDISSETISLSVKNNKISKNKLKNKTKVNSNKTVEIFENLFTSAEERLQNSIQQKLSSLKDENVCAVNKKHIKQKHNYTKSSLKMNSSRFVPDVDEPLEEDCGTISGSKSNQLVKKTVSWKDQATLSEANQQQKQPSIDPNKFVTPAPKVLYTELPDVITEGDEAIDEVEEKHMTIVEAFNDDDVVDEFRREKEEEKKSHDENIDLTLPGWGSWGGAGISKDVSRRKKRRFVLKLPTQAPRRDENKGNVIINEDKNTKLKEHQVSELPFPFTAVKDYEATLRAPLGNTWVPETAHRRLIKPSVVTKMGTIIEPMHEDVLLKKKGSP